MSEPRYSRLGSERTGIATFVAILVALGCSPGRGPSTDASPASSGARQFYSLSELPTLRITIADNELDKLARKPRKLVRGSLTYRNTTVGDIGVRLKGHRSMRSLDRKAAFKLRFDKYVPGQRWLGMRRLTLNNMVEDPTMLREILAYRLMRAAGVPAPAVGYARVYVNDTLYGLYLLVESVDDDFVASSFGDATGNLYEGEYGCDLFPEDVPGFDQDAGEDEGRSDLAAFAASVSGKDSHLFDEVAGPLAMKSFLAYLAVSSLIGDFDGYRHSHNYRIYRDPSLGKWFFIPWGLDRAFKKHLSIYDSEGLLAKRCFADPGCRLAYLRTMARVVDKLEALELDQGMAVIAAFIDEAARSDPRREHDDAAIARARDELRRFLRERPATVRRQLGCLENGVEVDRDGDGYGCMDCDDSDPAVNPGASEACDGLDNDCSGLADDAAECACPAVVVDGVTFHLCDLPMPWPDATEACAAQGMALARVDNPTQSAQLYRAARKHNRERWWIGLSDRQSEERFQWTDGSSLSADSANWAKGEPDNNGCNQDCVALKQGGKGRWHDTHCGQHRPFICR